METWREIEYFLHNYQYGDIKHLYLSPTEKIQVEEYLKNHYIGKNFSIVPGVFKPGFLEHDYYIEKSE